MEASSFFGYTASSVRVSFHSFVNNTLLDIANYTHTDNQGWGGGSFVAERVESQRTEPAEHRVLVTNSTFRANRCDTPKCYKRGRALHVFNAYAVEVRSPDTCVRHA
jgi:hypothetical protein